MAKENIADKNVADKEKYHKISLKLFELIENNDAPEIARLLKETDVNIQSLPEMPTVLGEIRFIINIAASKGNIEIINLLIQYGVDIETKEHNTMYCVNKTPLYFALKYHHFKLARFLISRGAEISKMYINVVQDENKGISSEYQKDADPIFLDQEIIDFLVKNDNNMDINRAIDKKGNTILHHAVIQNKDLVPILIKKYNAVIDSHNHNRQTPLHIAAAYLDETLSAVKYLLENGAAINSFDINDHTPLHMAANEDCQDIVKYLMENGADIKLKDLEGNTACDLAKKPIKLDIFNTDDNSNEKEVIVNLEIFQYLLQKYLFAPTNFTRQILNNLSPALVYEQYQAQWREEQSQYREEYQRLTNNHQQYKQYKETLVENSVYWYQDSQEPEQDLTPQYQKLFFQLEQQHTQEVKEIKEIYLLKLYEIFKEIEVCNNMEVYNNDELPYNTLADETGTTRATRIIPRVPPHLQFNRPPNPGYGDNYSPSFSSHTTPSYYPPAPGY